MQESHSPAAAPFTPEEIAEFQASDRHSAAVIVLLMTGIFTIGLLLYSYIALIV
jgi:hypothetical protein